MDAIDISILVFAAITGITWFLCRLKSWPRSCKSISMLVLISGLLLLVTMGSNIPRHVVDEIRDIPKTSNHRTTSKTAIRAARNATSRYILPLVSCMLLLGVFAILGSDCKTGATRSNEHKTGDKENIC